ncbi:29 kDa ribonucleoprotein A, chloroplastic-like [Salvia splendens]|uniref:29 kDa ribonucleoprotein A, chloroplastic-like n=1 Tax=Salvia splendens TaxID=180675 RepID=UPI001C27C5C9|nr:29 kDa ribonucleoprotein A, chloroplastic-like [Salvia splendens]
MALGAKEAAMASSIFSSFPPTSLHLHSSNKSLSSIKFAVANSPPSLKFNYRHTSKRSSFQLQSAPESLTTVADETTVEEEGEKIENSGNANIRRKLFVLNLPWSFSVADIKTLFSECGDVSDVEIIKQKDGKNRGFAFVTMASGDGAQAAIEKFDSYEVVGRIIRVQFAKRFKKPVRPAPVIVPPPGETRHRLYVSNLAWKARSNNLRELFSSNFNPVSARVIFGNPSGRSAGYGFVSFATKEEAESAINELDGKELLGRPIRLKFSERGSTASESNVESNSNAAESEAESSPEQPEES